MERPNDHTVQDQPGLRGKDLRYDSTYGVMANSAQIEGLIVSRGVAHSAMIDNERN